MRLVERIKKRRERARELRKEAEEVVRLAKSLMA